MYNLRFSTFFVLNTIASASTVINGIDVHADWRAPVAGDSRTPCPLLNTIANHGFINRNGYNITRDQLIPVLTEIVGVDEILAEFLFDEGLSTTDNPNGTSFDFNDVNQHNIIEHDGSLSRSDFYFGDAVSFSPEAFAQTRTFFVEEVIDLPQAIGAHVSRMNTSINTNPNFTLTERGNLNSAAESVFYMAVLGSKDSFQVDRARVEYFFEQERFPFHMGWQPEPRSISTDFVIDGIGQVSNLTGRDIPGFDERPVEKRTAISASKRNIAHFGKAFTF